MATQKVSPLPSFSQFTITAEEIARYAELTSLLTQLEKQKDTLRAELLELYADGAERRKPGRICWRSPTRSAAVWTGSLRPSRWRPSFMEPRASMPGS
jgi:hypothetical protein